MHAARVIAIRDISCGYGTVANPPQGASGFTTIELKADFLGTLREGAIFCRATPVHLGLARRTGSVLQSLPERVMSHAFGHLFFFYFPHPLAEGNV